MWPLWSIPSWIWHLLSLSFNHVGAQCPCIHSFHVLKLIKQHRWFHSLCTIYTMHVHCRKIWSVLYDIWKLIEKPAFVKPFLKVCCELHVHINCTTMHVYYYSSNVYRYNTTAIFFESFMIATMIWSTEYLCHKLPSNHWFVPFITCCKHFRILSSNMTYHGGL